MSKPYTFKDEEAICFFTCTTINWIDIFTRSIYRNILVDSLQFCVQNKGLVIYAYVIMTNHIHLIISKNLSSNRFSDIIRDFKKYTTMQIVHQLKEGNFESRKQNLFYQMKRMGRMSSQHTQFQMWQKGYHAVHLEESMIDQRLVYIHENPVRQGWVLEPWEYYYSSARNYNGLESPLKVTSIFDGCLI